MEYFKKLKQTFILAWSFFKVFLQIVYGAWKLQKIQRPSVSIFGSHRITVDSPYADMAHKIARALVSKGISVVTGGGPGIMEAANAGASHLEDPSSFSIGIGVRGLKGEEGLNPYVKSPFILDYFFARKYLLITYSFAYIVLPGGIGTLDELAELMNLIETEKQAKGPIVLIGKSYWKHLIEWFETAIEAKAFTRTGAYSLLTVTDDIDEAIKIVTDHCERCKTHGLS